MFADTILILFISIITALLGEGMFFTAYIISIELSFAFICLKTVFLKIFLKYEGFLVLSPIEER